MICTQRIIYCRCPLIDANDSHFFHITVQTGRENTPLRLPFKLGDCDVEHKLVTSSSSMPRRAPHAELGQSLLRDGPLVNNNILRRVLHSTTS